MIYNLFKKYLKQYQFHIYNFKQIKFLDKFEFDLSGELLSIYEIVVKLYKICFKINYSNEIIYNSLFNNKNLDNHIYFLTSGRKIIIYGFLWTNKNSNNYTIETVCKNFILNYDKLCFILLFNLIIYFKKNFLNKNLTLEVSKNNFSAIECYRQLGFTGPIQNGIETIKLSNRGNLIYEIKFGNFNNIKCKLIKKNNFKKIKIDNLIIYFKNFKDINGNIKYYYNVETCL